MNPWRVLGFVAVVIALCWLWLGPVWAVVAAVFVVPPWMIIAIQWKVRGPRRITPEQRAAIDRVRVWQDPVWRWWGLAFGVVGIACVVLPAFPAGMFVGMLALAKVMAGVAFDRAPEGVHLTSWADPSPEVDKHDQQLDC